MGDSDNKLLKFSADNLLIFILERLVYAIYRDEASTLNYVDFSLQKPIICIEVLRWHLAVKMLN